MCSHLGSWVVNSEQTASQSSPVFNLLDQSIFKQWAHFIGISFYLFNHIPLLFQKQKLKNFTFYNDVMNFPYKPAGCPLAAACNSKSEDNAGLTCYFCNLQLRRNFLSMVKFVIM